MEECIVTIRDYNEKFEKAIEVEDVKRIARENGLKQMEVRDENGNKLSPNDFPYEGNISLQQVNKAGT